MSKDQIDGSSKLGLAHRGDCVYEMLVRDYLCAQRNTTVAQLHKQTIAMVKAT